MARRTFAERHQFSSLTQSLTGVARYDIGARLVVEVTTGGKTRSVPRAALSANFGPLMKQGAFGMVDAFEAAARKHKGRANG